MSNYELQVDIAVVKDMNKLIRKQMKAIDAIMELHKPEGNTTQQCSHDKKMYPCSTIEAIRKELSGE